MRRSVALIVALTALLGGCGAKETLLAKPARVPAGLDLSGQWLLRDTSGTTQPAARETLVHVFLEMGKAVKVTQTDSALFVSFDRSVVEEYRFGENRTVSVGEITADRVSGWEGGAYVIETLDKNGAKLIDSYRLSEGGRELRRTISLWSKNTKQLGLEQVFDPV